MIVFLFIIGSRQNLFDDTITLKTQVTDAVGLQEGSSVRFMGINIGSVERISIVNDTSVSIILMIDNDQAPFITKDSKAVINSDGLMGNKLITLIAGTNSSDAVVDGDEIASLKPIGMENVMNSVLENSRNLEKLTTNLIEITAEISSGKGLIGKLLFDSTAVNEFERVMTSTSQMAKNLESTTANFQDVSNKISNGEGTLGRLIYDNSIANGLTNIIDSLSSASSNMNEATMQINDFSRKLNNGNGAMSRLVNDTTMANNLDETIENAKERTAELEETIDIVNDSWILNLFGGNKKKKKQEASTKSKQENQSKIHEIEHSHFIAETSQ